jgi:hypothetical protein
MIIGKISSTVLKTWGLVGTIYFKFRLSFIKVSRKNIYFHSGFFVSSLL